MTEDSYNKDTDVAKQLKKLIEANQYLADIEFLDLLFPKLLQEKERLKDALQKVKTFSSLTPICSHCKKIRDDKGYWNQIESYVRDHSEAEFSHGICQECAKKYYPDMDLYGDEQTQG